MNHEGATHFSWNDRLTLARMIKEGFKKPEIAKALGKCERSIYYEINRGLCEQLTTDLEKVVIYCPEVAHRKYREFLAEKGPDLKIGHDHALVKKLEELIVEQHFSPGAALAYIRNSGETYSTEISEKTLYNYIYRGDVFLVLDEKHLCEKGRRHYAEMGCKGSKQALLVLTERRTRMGIMILVEDHTAASVVKAINRLERKFGKLFYTLFKSITVDNGSEFQDFEGIEIAHRRKGKRTIVFFCHPYSAYERGSNENMNRLIRRFFPKGTNFDEVTKEQVAEAERWINNYPRKLLGWKSAADLFDEERQAA